MPSRSVPVLLALGALALGCEDKYLLLRDGEFIIVNATIDGDIVIKDCSSNDSLNCTDKITVNLCQRSCRNCPAPASPPSSPIAKDTTPPPPSPTTMPTTPPPPSSPTPLAPASMAPTSPLPKGENPAATSASAPQSASVGVAAAPSPSPTPGPPEEDPCAASAASGLLSPTDECRVYRQSAHAAPDAHADAPRSSTSSWDTWGPLVVLAAAAYCVYRCVGAPHLPLQWPHPHASHTAASCDAPQAPAGTVYLSPRAGPRRRQEERAQLPAAPPPARQRGRLTRVLGIAIQTSAHPEE